MSSSNFLRTNILRNYDPFIVSLLEKYNPLGLTDDNGRSCIYTQPFLCYYGVMMVAYVLGPKGYVETDYLLKKIYKHLSAAVCGAIAKSLTPLEIPAVVCFKGWPSEDGRAYLERLIIGLSSILQVPYNSEDFKQAWGLFLNKIESEELIKNEKGEKSEK